MSMLTEWYGWVGLGLILLIAEMAVSGGFLLWTGIAAVLVGALALIFPTISGTSQMLLFSVLAVVVCFAWWSYLKSFPTKTDDPQLNRRSEQYVGRTFKLIDPIVNGRGKIHVGDTMWAVTSNVDLPADAVVKVIRAEGVTLVVEEFK